MSIANDLDKMHNLFERFSDLMEENIRGVKLGCYSVALIGFTIAVRRVRPFSRFKKPSDIPNRFVRERRELIGTVDRIDPNGALLMVKHKPLIRLLGTDEAALPVKISGINITGHGVNWLQAIVVGNEITFIPILKEANCVKCEVKLDQKTYNNKVRTINVGESLLSVGFGNLATVEKPLVNNFEYSLYYNRLKAAENYAEKRKLGFKYYVKPAQVLFLNLIRKLGRSLGELAKPPAKSPKLAIQ